VSSQPIEQEPGDRSRQRGFRRLANSFRADPHKWLKRMMMWPRAASNWKIRTCPSAFRPSCKRRTGSTRWLQQGRKEVVCQHRDRLLVFFSGSGHVLDNFAAGASMAVLYDSFHRDDRVSVESAVKYGSRSGADIERETPDKIGM